MNKLENALRRALRREEPAPDFAARVMTRIRTAEMTAERSPQREAGGRVLRILRVPRLQWVAAALAACLLVTVLVSASVVHQRRVQRERGELARRQAMLALEIASTKLNFALKQVKKVEGEESGARTKRAGRMEKL